MKTHHENSFGFLRLLFAVAVIVGHSPELIDGNRSREPLTLIFGSLSLGEVAVAGFFLISGYLITESYERSSSTGSYLLKRARRIFPGYAVAYLISLAVIGPLVGGDAGHITTFVGAAKNLAKLGLLGTPYLPGSFSGLPYPVLNGAMWTIAYEARCYILAIPLAALLLRTRYFPLLLAAILILLAPHLSFSIGAAEHLAGYPANMARLLSFFVIGALFYKNQSRISYTDKYAFAALIGLAASLFVPFIADLSFAVFGGYLIFWFALRPNMRIANRINNTTDISYGTYLYGWPIQSLIIYFFPETSPWALAAIATPLALACGYASWVCVEQWFKAPKRPTLVERTAAQPAAS